MSTRTGIVFDEDTYHIVASAFGWEVLRHVDLLAVLPSRTAAIQYVAEAISVTAQARVVYHGEHGEEAVVIGSPANDAPWVCG